MAPESTDLPDGYQQPSDGSTPEKAPSNVAVQEKPSDAPPPPDPAQDAPDKKRRKIPKPLFVGGAIALAAGIGFGIYRLFFYEPAPDGLFLSGRIEGYETDVSAKVGGRIQQVAVREGERVKPGQLLVRMDAAELQAQLRGAIARVQVAQERVQRSRQQLPVLEAQLQQAQLETQQARQESEGRVLEARNAVAEARARLVESQENLALAQASQRRVAQLYAEGAETAQNLDEANAAVGTAQARVAASAQQVESAQGRLVQAQATRSNPPIRAAAELQVQRQIVQARTDISTALQEVKNAQAEQAQIQANLNDLVVLSPLAGSVITRLVEPGEVVAAGAPLLTLVNLNTLYLRGFIPEGQIGKVRLGQSAQVYLDSFPDRPLDATVSRVDPRASFTPENTYFKEDRVNQVFGVELTLTNPQGFAKPGMPADGRILVPEAGEQGE